MPFLQGDPDIVEVRTRFRTPQHAFPFPNVFPAGTPLLEVRSPFGALRIGDCSNGLCGGFVYGALDFFYSNRPTPRFCNEVVRNYLVWRLFDSFGLPFGPVRIYRLMATRGDSSSLYQQSVLGAWPRVRRHLHNLRPVPLILIRTESKNPWQLGKNHQVLATGYDYDAPSGRVSLQLYDPNYPVGGDGGAPVTLTFTSRPKDRRGQWMEHSLDGDSVRGFMVNSYRYKEPPLQVTPWRTEAEA